MKTWPTLFKRTSNGSLQEWTIIVDGAYYWTKFGQTGGKIQVSEKTKCEPKNVGQSNATTAEQQAILEAKAEWTKKQKRSGYVLTAEAALGGETSELIQGGMWPLLAQHYKDNVKNVVWPCYAQFKFNGHRCIAMTDSEGVATLWSRKRNPIVTVPHIVEAITALDIPNLRLDGELFAYEFVRKNGLEEFNHLVKRSSPIPGHEIAELYIYDAPIENIPQKERFAYLDKQIGSSPAFPLRRVETKVVHNITEAMAYLAEAIDDDYEGIMLRRMDGLYLGHPTHHTKELLKLKGADGMCDDGEFLVVGVKEGNGKMQGKAIFKCVTDEGNPFDAKMKGSVSRLRHYWEHPEEVVGKKITIQYNGWTNKNVPWFPRALQIREDL